MLEKHIQKNDDESDNDCLAALTRILEMSDSDVVFDVGANIGQFAQALLSRNYCQIHSFEPGRDAFLQLEAASLKNSRIIPHQIAIDEVPGVFDFYISESDVGSSLLEPIKGQESKWAKTVATEKVICQRIDDLFERLNLTSIALLKTDTQGADGRVLKSAGEFLSPEHIGAVLVELNFHTFYQEQTPWESIVALLSERGYFLAGFYPHYNRQGWLWWADGLFLPSRQPYTT